MKQDVIHIDLTTPEGWAFAREEILGRTEQQMAHLLSYAVMSSYVAVERGTALPSTAVMRMAVALLEGYQPPHWPGDAPLDLSAIKSNASLLKARKLLRLSQEDMSFMLGYSHPSRLCEIERNRRNASAAVCTLMAYYMDGYRPADWPAPQERGMTLLERTKVSA